METKLCECGCGEVVRPGRRWGRGHYISAKGRMMIWQPDKKKYEYRYRVVMETHIGRPLMNGECVHHRNQNTLDDRIENLLLCGSNAEHISEHHGTYQADFACDGCGASIRGDIRQRHHFCNRKCWETVKLGGRPVTSGKGLRITFVCQQCGKQTTRKGHRGDRLFCSHSCYSASLKGQTGLTRSNGRTIEHGGETLTVSEWARRLGVPDRSLFNRLYLGWSDEESLTTPFRKSPRR